MELISLTMAFLLQFMIRCIASAGASIRVSTSLQTTHDSLNLSTKSLTGYAKKFLGSEHQELNFMEPVETKSNQSTENTFNNRRLFSNSGNSQLVHLLIRS
jgi:hypothetical protein